MKKTVKETKKKPKKRKIGKMLKKMGGTSNLEVKFAELLTEHEIAFEHHVMFKNREYDFLLTDYSILIETHGCFYHCCKTHSPEAKYAFQRRNLKNDQLKVKNVKFDTTYTLLVIWEHELEKPEVLMEKVIRVANKKLLD